MTAVFVVSIDVVVPLTVKLPPTVKFVDTSNAPVTETLSPISTTVESTEVIELFVMLIPPDKVKFDIP